MKKIAILILSILIAGLFVACNQDITVDAQTYANMEAGTFVLNGQNYATLQEAVNAKLGKSAKAVGANDGVIYLTRNASGPGAVINSAVTGGVTIDFAGYTYSFTNVTGLQGGEAPKPESFGLAVTNGAQVTLKGMEKIDLNDKSTSALTMVYIEGAETKLSIESAPKMVVEPEQYVFWAANGATLTIGGETQVGGGVAATGSTTEESKPTITLTGSSSVTGSINATSAKVNVEETSKIEASVVASENTTVIVSSKDNVITTLDKTTDSTVIITEKVQINDVTGEDNEVVIAGDGDVVDASGDESKDVEPSTQTTYVAMVGTDLYETFTEALEAVGEEGELFLLADLNENISIPETMSLKLNFGSYDIGAKGAPVDITVNGDLYVTGSGYVYVDYYSQVAETYAVLDGGKYRFSDMDHMISYGNVYFIEGTFNVISSSFVPDFCKVTYNIEDETWTVSRVKEKEAVASITIEEETLYFETLEKAVSFAENGMTIELLQDISLDNKMTIEKSLILNLGTHKISGSDLFSIVMGEVTIKNGTLDATNYALQIYGNTTSAENYTTVNIASNAEIKGKYAIIIRDTNSDKNCYGVTLNVDGKVSGRNPIWVMGNICVGNSVININNGAVLEVTNVTEKDDNTCIANNGYVTTNIKDGAVLKGFGTAIEVRAGIVNITGGTFSSSVSPADVTPNGNGTTTKGAAVGVAQHTTKLNTTVNISGGTFNGYHALYINNPQVNDAGDVNVSVSGGTFNKNVDTSPAAVVCNDTRVSKFITGGVFNTDPSAYVADGYKVVLDDDFYVVVGAVELELVEAKDSTCTDEGNHTYWKVSDNDQQKYIYDEINGILKVAVESDIVIPARHRYVLTGISNVDTDKGTCTASFECINCTEGDGHTKQEEWHYLDKKAESFELYATVTNDSSFEDKTIIEVDNKSEITYKTSPSNGLPKSFGIICQVNDKPVIHNENTERGLKLYNRFKELEEKYWYFTNVDFGTKGRNKAWGHMLLLTGQIAEIGLNNVEFKNDSTSGNDDEYSKMTSWIGLWENQNLAEQYTYDTVTDAKSWYPLKDKNASTYVNLKGVTYPTGEGAKPLFQIQGYELEVMKGEYYSAAKVDGHKDCYEAVHISFSAAGDDFISKQINIQSEQRYHDGVHNEWFLNGKIMKGIPNTEGIYGDPNYGKK